MTGDLSVRNLPYSREAEMSVIGAILLDPQCITEVAQIITSDDFYSEAHKHLYEAMTDMFLHNREIDAVTLIDTLVTNGHYSESGGKEYIKLIAETVPTSANVIDYCNIVHDKSLLRRLIAVCEETAELAYSESESVSSILDLAEQRVFELAQGKEKKDFVHIKTLLANAYGTLQRIAENKEELTGTQTGFTLIDKVLVGMGKGDLILIGARPGMGKTSFAMNIATSVAKKTKKAVAVFSLEMSDEQLVTRMLSSEALVDSNIMRSGNIDLKDTETWGKLARAGERLSGCDIYIDDTSGITVTGMKAKLRRLKNLGLVVIDYLQLMQSEKHIENRVQEVGDISRNLKLLAKELQVPLIVCAQLSRGPEQRTDKKPQLSDLRDSGAIEQDADVVMFIYREEYYKNDGNAPNMAEIIIAKNRHGSVGRVNVGWQAQYTSFINVDDTHGES